MNKDKHSNDSNIQFAYSIKQLSILTSISRSKLFLEIKNGNLKVFKCGKRTLATKQAVQEWIETLSSSK